MASIKEKMNTIQGQIEMYSFVQSIEYNMPTWPNDAQNLKEAPDMLDEDKKPAEAQYVSVDFQLDKVHFVIKG